MKTTTTSILPASMSWTRIPTICVNIWGKIFFQPRADENIRFLKRKNGRLLKSFIAENTKKCSFAIPRETRLECSDHFLIISSLVLC